MAMQKVIKKAVGEYIRVDADWLKENAEWIYHWILEALEDFADDPQNEASEEDIGRWKEKGFIADVYFGEEGIEVTAGFDVEELNNQPTWFVTHYSDFPKEELKKLLLRVKED